MPYSWIAIPDFVFDQAGTYTLQNSQIDNAQDLHDSFATEHNFADGIHTIIRQASVNIADSPAPAPRGGVIVCFEGKLALPAYVLSTPQYTTGTLDSSIDWRDRKIKLEVLVILCADGTKADKFLPGGASDQKTWMGYSSGAAGGAAAGSGSYVYFSNLPLDADADATAWDYSQAFGYSEAGSAAGATAIDRIHAGANRVPDVSGEVWSIDAYVDSTAGTLKASVYRSCSANNLTGYYVVIIGQAIAFSDEGHV